MEIQDSSAAIYSEAKSEYTKQLVFNFQPALLRFFLDRFNEVKRSQVVTSKTKSALSEFQDSLSQIPEWNLDKVHTETSILLNLIHCDYIEELITAVFIAHTKILSAIRLHSKPRRKINITVPKPDHFMHRTMSECSRLLWSNVYLFSDSVPSIERQKNMNEVNRFLEEGILQAIRNLLPVKSILRDSLQEDEDDAIQLNTPEVTENTPLATPEALPEDNALPEDKTLPEDKALPEEKAIDESKNIKVTESSTVVDVTKIPETLIIDTEKSVDFTGIDSVFGNGDAELRTTVEEGDDDLKIIGDFEELNMNDIEDINMPESMATPLGADDYESL
jgi:hypothetical protein